ncbi:hypothetical protein [Candidatus Korobacter versatilis]|uniref:hypothetical protein n=1 Tax=Candidatus Korobacter versatilis TaxID=658062 RepID=UPI0002D5934D|nr:hypothetical protein [Candidatus Koribacter versatilis]
METDQIVELAMEGLVTATKLIAELKAQGQLTDQQLLDFAATKDAETRDRIEKFLAGQKPV